MATLDDIAARLAGAGIGLTIGSNLFMGSLPDAPDAVVALRPYGGFSPLHTMGQDNAIRRPTIQVVARGEEEDYEAAQTKIEQCFTALTTGSVTINGNRYLRIEPLQDPFPIRRDENGRWELAFNILIHKG